jgi:hypothetical protein
MDSSAKNRSNLCCDLAQKLSVSINALFNISKMLQNIVEFHKLLKNNLMALRQSDDISESANEDIICNDLQMCKIVTEEETECKTTVNTNKIDNKLFECIWLQCRYSYKTKTMLRQHIKL